MNILAYTYWDDFGYAIAICVLFLLIFLVGCSIITKRQIVISSLVLFTLFGGILKCGYEISMEKENLQKSFGPIKKIEFYSHHRGGDTEKVYLVDGRIFLHDTENNKISWIKE
jgi:hypothetical protein